MLGGVRSCISNLQRKKVLHLFCRMPLPRIQRSSPPECPVDFRLWTQSLTALPIQPSLSRDVAETDHSVPQVSENGPLQWSSGLASGPYRPYNSRTDIAPLLLPPVEGRAGFSHESRLLESSRPVTIPIQRAQRHSGTRSTLWSISRTSYWVTLMPYSRAVPASQTLSKVCWIGVPSGLRPLQAWWLGSSSFRSLGFYW